jgi:hypothetical protein
MVRPGDALIFSVFIWFCSVFLKPFPFYIPPTVMPQILPFTFGEESINVGENVAVQCMVLKGDLPMKISWLHNEAPILPNQGYKQIDISQRISTLNIDTLKSVHRGNYTCVARNVAGFTDYSTHLNINGSFFNIWDDVLLSLFFKIDPHSCPLPYFL